MNETIRDAVKRRLCLAFTIGGVGRLILVWTLIFQPIRPTEWLPIGSIGATLFGGGVILFLFHLKCPGCSGSLGPVIDTVVLRWGRCYRLRFCLYCGVNLDDQLLHKGIT